MNMGGACAVGKLNAMVQMTTLFWNRLSWWCRSYARSFLITTPL